MSSLFIAALLLAPLAEEAEPDAAPPVSTHQLLLEGQRALRNVEALLRTYGDEEAAEKEKGVAELQKSAKLMREAVEQLTATERTAMKNYQARFAKVTDLDKSRWKIAPRQQRIDDKPPDVVSITAKDGQTIIRMEDSKKPFHACLDFPLREGDRLAIQFSLTEKARAGGTPVPYFGVRDEFGAEAILFHFGSYPQAAEVHELLLEYRSELYSSVWNKQVSTARVNEGKSKKFLGPGYLFFHMNDTSEVVIHSVKSSRPADADE